MDYRILQTERQLEYWSPCDPVQALIAIKTAGDLYVRCTQNAPSHRQHKPPTLRIMRWLLLRKWMQRDTSGVTLLEVAANAAAKIVGGDTLEDLREKRS